jgi:uncharacterized protein YaaN involved in tellurite resistance
MKHTLTTLRYRENVKYFSLIEHYAKSNYKTLDDDQVNKLVAAYIRTKDRYDQEEAIAEAIFEYHKDVLDALAGKIDAVELQKRLLNPVVKQYKDQVMADYEEELSKNHESDEGEFWEDFRKRGADAALDQPRSF